MKKGKLKNKKDYLSIMFVPHSSDKVKVLKFSSFYLKLGTISVLIAAFIICTAMFIVYTVNENTRLKGNISKLYELNMEQNDLLLAKANEIESLKTHDERVNSVIIDFMEKYRNLTDNYVASRIDVNRTGSKTVSHDDSSFADDINELKDLLLSLNSLSSSVDKNLVDLSETESKLKKYLDSIPTLWPVSGKITSTFGGRRDPFVGRRTFHEGIDVALSYGQEIKASADGKVILSRQYSGYGRTVIIDHGQGITTLYAHCSSLLVKEGRTVKKGDIIAKAGSTGRSTGPHLHFEIRINDEPVDPTKYLGD